MRVTFLAAALGVGLALCPSRGRDAEKPAERTFHVAPDGSDNNPGTREKPFATLRRARDNVFEHNHVHDIGHGMLSDMGGIYTLGVQPGTVVRNNVFHDIRAFRYGGWGIYFDEGSSRIVAENNLVYHTTHGGFHQHYGRENVVRNNVFAFGRDAQIRRTRAEDHRSFTFERNVVYWADGKLLDGNWGKLNVAFDRNLYWKAGGGEVKLDKYTWEQWRAKGMDEHSLIGDPLFAYPVKGEFRLREGSPARKVGFVAPDFSDVGPRPAESGRGSRPSRRW